MGFDNGDNVCIVGRELLLAPADQTWMRTRGLVLQRAAYNPTSHILLPLLEMPTQSELATTEKFYCERSG